MVVIYIIKMRVKTVATKTALTNKILVLPCCWACPMVAPWYTLTYLTHMKMTMVLL